MKRLLLIIILICIVYVFGRMVFSGAQTFSNNATIVLSGISNKKSQEIIRNHYEKEVLHGKNTLAKDAGIIMTPAYVNTDTDIDIIARVESKDTCGSGGCITTIFLQTNPGVIEPLSFAFAVKSLRVLDTITQGMHDIEINDSSVLVWNGKEYTARDM